MVKSETLAMPLFSGMVEPVYYVRPKITVKCKVADTPFNTKLTNILYSNNEYEH